MADIKNFIFVFLLLLLVCPAQSETAGPGCSVEWDYADPLPSDVDGFRLYLDTVMVWEGTPKLVNCADFSPTIAVGTHDLYVVAYNDVAESAQSNTVTFDYVTGGPASAPINLRFAN